LCENSAPGRLAWALHRDTSAAIPTTVLHD